MFTNCTHPCSQPKSRHKTFLAKPPGGHAWPIVTGSECLKPGGFARNVSCLNPGWEHGCVQFVKKETGNTFLLAFNLLIYLLIYLSNNTILYRRLRVVKITKTLKSGSRDGEKQMLQALPQGSLHRQKEEVSRVGLGRPCRRWGTTLLQAVAQRACMAHSYRIWLPHRMTEMQISWLINIRNIIFLEISVANLWC